MADAQYPPAEGGDSPPITQTDGDARYVRKNGISTLSVGTVEPTSPATNDIWIDTN